MIKKTTVLMQVTLPVFQMKIASFTLFLLMIILTWLLLVYFSYDLSLYYLYQFLPFFAQLLNIALMFALLIATLYLYNQLYQKYFRRSITFKLYQQGIALDDSKQAAFFSWQDLIQIQLRQQQTQIHSFSLLSTSNPYRQYFYFNSWMWPATLTRQHCEFLPFWKKLEALAKQQQLQRIRNTSTNKKTHIDIISIIANQQALNTFQRKQKWFGMGLILVILASFSLFMSYLLWHEFDDGSIDLPHQQTQSISGTNFETFQNQVYIFKQGQGTFLVPQAKANQFTGLALSNLPDRADELYSNVGKTPQHVYWQDHILSQLNPAQTSYLGNDFTKDGQQVYFRDIHLTNANAAHFSAVLHPTFNALVYFYAKDDQQVFYKTQVLTDLDPQQSQAFPNSSQYIHDQHVVYYRDKKLQGLDAQQTQIFSGSNRFSQNLNLATDGQSFYLNEHPLPHIAEHKFWGTTPVDLSHLQLIGSQSNEPYPGNFSYIFADQQNIYIYDEFYQRLKVLYHFPQPIQLQALEDRRFSDGKNIYIITEKIYRSKGRSSGTTTHGFKISLIREQDQQIIAQYFSRNPSALKLSNLIHDRQIN
ncbi:DKNYY domain-containing protein [Acinetobacter dispersus]|uniref:DKNYY domain-containing protein n=1 Tax=Acinetobacter dispersus TaxID=70348 RepID=UPI001F4B510D|nr:DKNYY domain-containing protein [Acinetobacter dispersus]MCH7394791.1 DKNYY domain-containing protein [Acinetobacter dispersus]